MSVITDTMTEVGISQVLTVAVDKDKASACLYGDFKARLSLERSNDSGVTWESVDSFSGAAFSISSVIPGCCFRFNCSEYTSGTINVELSDDNEVLDIQFNSSGAKVFEVHEDGINVIGKIKHNGVAVHE